MTKKKIVSNAQKHIDKGDGWMKKKKPGKALIEYKKALACDPDLKGIYDKLIAAHDLTPREWDEKDFAESVTWTMKKQEQENPPIKQVHARLTPEWKKATELAMRMFVSEDKESVKKLTEELVAMGEIATRAMIGILLDIKHAGAEKNQ